VGNDNHLVFRQELLDEYGRVRRGVVMVKHPGLFSPNFGATSSHVFTQSDFTLWPFGPGASRYHICCVDGGTNPEYFMYYLVHAEVFGGSLYTEYQEESAARRENIP
jgi:hypothetical protein